MKISKRHLAKTVTWRFIGTLDTMLLGWLISGNPMAGVKIGFAEVITKMVLYYLHERVWFRFNFPDSRPRHLIKTLSWRAIGTLDTMVLAWIITGNPMTGLQIGGAEVITKMILYYLHERGWYRINYGLDQRNKIRKLQHQREAHAEKH
ncbi:DUF2061 domain-containing protein [Robertkochia marina]|uniref:DUF2061 domain-containing protein n=1 Tax=Robertkochia marina TaxID=1227945 RepID=A0A4S3M139_9FLAO|nr:DUF2061 domain-containing protein [Robertkochia marina]TRZ40969.1 DUF2061 domain-containing protein [Robertkochia marina]